MRKMMRRTWPPSRLTLTDLLDVNVWLAISVGEHPHHPRALRYWHPGTRRNGARSQQPSPLGGDTSNESDERLAFCRVTALAFLRLLTNAAVMGGQPLHAGEAWSIYRT